LSTKILSKFFNWCLYQDLQEIEDAGLREMKYNNTRPRGRGRRNLNLAKLRCQAKIN
jgi:hypothetical protein